MPEENADDIKITEDEAESLLADAVAESESSDTDDDTDQQSRLAQLQRDVDKWKGLARKHEGRARENASAVTQSKTLQQQLDEMKSQLAERDASEVERNGKLALSGVHTRLAEAGITRSDVAGLLDLVDPTGLLADGQPDDEAIDKLANSLLKVAGRASPDPDQGKHGGNAPMDMNAIIRRAAGVTTS